MPLPAGTWIGVFEITGTLGAGGMREVYRATDTKLKRAVALKILPAVATDPDRLARFQREAEVLAALNHPHIAAIHGVEESGDVHALVMELVEGPTLAERIARGPLPLDEALLVAKQIADALEAAHEQGIILRDLKPANIKVRDDGTVKVLDFGLAKAMPYTNSTITSPALMTGSECCSAPRPTCRPSRRRGVRPTSAATSGRSAASCRKCTGRRAFDGGDMTDTLGAVVWLEPNWAALPAAVPPPLHTLLPGSRS